MHVPCSYVGCSSVSCTLLPAEGPCHLLLGISGASPQQQTRCSRMLHTHQERGPCSRLPPSWRIFVLLFTPRLLGASQHRGLTDLCAGEAEQHGQLGLAQGDLLCLPPQHAPALGLHLALCTHTSGCR